MNEDVGATVDNEWNTLKTERNRKLAECDWTQLLDNGLSEEKKAEWLEYRQALRDLPETYPDPNVEIFWPTKVGK
jgi:hypothetical protein